MIPSALLHDIARVEESKDKTGELDHAILGSEIARTFMLAGQFGQRLIANEPLNDYLESNTVEKGRLKDISKHTPFIEYEVKLKKIPNKLYTKKAKEIGKERLKFMEDYFNRLMLEIDGIK